MKAESVSLESDVLAFHIGTGIISRSSKVKNGEAYCTMSQPCQYKNDLSAQNNLKVSKCTDQ